jgi:hypothetical protein
LSRYLLKHILGPCNHWKGTHTTVNKKKNLCQLVVIHQLVAIRTYLANKAYYVPTTLFVFPSVSFELNIFARPKSEILGFISESRRMLLAFTSLCIMRNLECLCKYRSPCAVPSIMIRRLFQLSKLLLFSSAH